MAAWEFYQKNANSFVKDFGLMPRLIDELKLEPPAKEIFLTRLSQIHEAILDIQAEKLKRELNNKGT